MRYNRYEPSTDFSQLGIIMACRYGLENAISKVFHMMEKGFIFKTSRNDYFDY